MSEKFRPPDIQLFTKEKEGSEPQPSTEKPKGELSYDKPRPAERGTENVTDAIATVQRRIDQLTVQQPVAPAVDRQANYVQKYLPEHLQTYSPIATGVSFVMRGVVRAKEMMGKLKVEGREHIPAHGPLLVVSNHRGGETGPLLGLFGDKPFHVAAGETLNFKRSKVRNWLLKKLGMIPVKESLAHLSSEQKTALLARTPARSREGYEQIIQQEQTTLPFNRDFLRGACAALMKGERVCVFPEGLFTYEGSELRQAYPGVELLVKEYKKQTGQDLPILPVGFSKNSIAIGSPFLTPEQPSVDVMMQQIAALLPEQERGVYAKKE